MKGGIVISPRGRIIDNPEISCKRSLACLGAIPDLFSSSPMLTWIRMFRGFMIFWPLGLAMLVYILWGDRLDELKSEVNRATDNVASSFNFGNSNRTRYSHSSGGAASRNGAFYDLPQDFMYTVLETVEVDILDCDGNNKLVDCNLLMSKKKIPVRLVARPVPQNIANERIRKKKKDSYVESSHEIGRLLDSQSVYGQVGHVATLSEL